MCYGTVNIFNYLWCIQFDVKRRQYLSRAGVATFLGVSLAGCSSTSNESDEGTTTEPNGSGGDSGEGGNGGDETPALNECPMIPGTYTRFDPEDGPLPFSFEYPEVVSMEYRQSGPDELATAVSGSLKRNDDELSRQGRITVEAAINANVDVSSSTAAIDRWYEERSNKDTLLTTTINGADVQFVALFPMTAPEGRPTSSFSEDQKVYTAQGLVPYRFEDRAGNDRARFHSVEMSAGISLADDTDVTSSCAGNLLTTLENAVQSIEMRRNAEAFEERVSYNPP